MTEDEVRSLERSGWKQQPITGDWTPPSWYWSSRHSAYIVPNGGRVAPGWRVLIGGQLVRE